jgi:hypothetical protein
MLLIAYAAIAGLARLAERSVPLAGGSVCPPAQPMGGYDGFQTV